jgi:predicted exporter
MSGLWRALLALTILAIAGLIASRHLDLDFRLDAFLPVPADTEQALVVDQIGAGPGGRLILAAVEGGELDDLIEFSSQLAERWRELDGVERVDNGEFELDPETETLLMQTRFLLVDDIDQRVSSEAIRASLDDRLAELAMAGRQIERLVRRDPLGLLPELAETLTVADAAENLDGVWLDEAGERALLVVVSAWPPFAIAEQTELVASLKAGFEELDRDAQWHLALGGAPVIAVDSASRSRSNAIALSIVGSAFLLLVLSWAWRSPVRVIAGALPLAAGVVCGTVVTALVFEQVHGLTLAFGFTLLGVALDYPIHLFGHGAGARLDESARRIRTPLLLGAASTLIAYLAIWASTSPGLAQLGAFSAAGLAGAALTTLLLPALGVKASSTSPTHPGWSLHLPWLPIVLALIALAVFIGLGPQRWSADLTRLSPVNLELMDQDRKLRQAIRASDVRHLLVLHAEDLETLLQQAEATGEVLAMARDQDILGGWQSPADFVPSRQRQQQRREAWPDADTLAERLEQAGSRFRADAFAAFLDDRKGLDDLAPIEPDTWRGSVLELRVDGQLSPTEDGWRAIIVPSALTDTDALEALLSEHQAPARLVDLRASSEAMVAAYRQDAGRSLAIALGLIVVVLLIRLRTIGLTVRVLIPPLAAVMCTAAGFALFDQGLTIVHLVGLLLAAGIGLDFALFSSTLAGDARSRARTNQAVSLCALSSGGVFLILGQSDIGLLRMLGLTVATGILLAWLFARLCQPPTGSQ